VYKEIMTDRPDQRRTLIVATLGPASCSPEVIAALALAGMDIARINFSHASHQEAALLVQQVRELPPRPRGPVEVLGDLRGPRVRLGALDAPRELAEGEALTLTAEPGSRGPRVLPIDEAALADEVEDGTRIYLQDGAIELEVMTRSARQLQVVTRRGGTLGSHAGVHIPGVELGLPAVSERDRADIAFAAAQRMDWLALSFVSRAEDLSEARAALASAARSIRLVAKIESGAALERLDAIAEAADGLMVARGDLGVAIGVEEVPIAQHRIIAAAKRRGIPAIVATEMLESMRTRARPTRAEASDVAHAVWDGADALMLSAETAVGDFAVAAVETMARVIRRAESVTQED
jgi:pyruvate kinase